MALHRPIVRHFIACERVEIPADRKHYSLHNIVHSIRPSPGYIYPRIHPEVALFTVLSDGRGSLRFSVEIATWIDQNEVSIHQSPTVTMDLGKDPLVVHGWPIRLRNILFPQMGYYEFRLYCEGDIIAREPLVLKESK